MSRPPFWQVGLLALCCAGMVWSFARGAANAEWPWWLACFLVMELAAAANAAPGDTLSERTWCWLGIRPRRALRWIRIAAIVAFLVELTLHFATGGIYSWSGGLAVVLTASPVGVVIAYSLAFERRDP